MSLFSSKDEQLNEKLLSEAYTSVKHNLRNVLLSAQHCALCLNNQRESFYRLNFAGVSNEDECSFEGMMMLLFNEKDLGRLSTDYICNLCQRKLQVSFSFVKLVKNRSQILNTYFDQISNHTGEVQSLLKSSKGADFANTVILLQSGARVRGELVKESKETNVFKCDLCGQTCQTKSAIAYHINKMHTKRTNKKIRLTNKCSECPKFPCAHEPYLIYMKRHRRHSKLYKCLDCSFASSIRSHMIGHINKVHLNLLPHLCEMCGKSFPSKVAHKGHINLYHLRCCSYCHNGSFKNQSDLQEHEAYCKTVSKPYKCDSCPASFIDSARLHLHSRSHTPRYQCTHCPKVFMHEVSMMRHRSIAHDGGARDRKEMPRVTNKQCSICRATFNNALQLKHHLNTHKAGEKHRCDVCKRSFETRKKYMAHSRSWKHLARVNPKMTFSYTCDECDFSCPSAQPLENHKNLFHLKIKPYICPECSKAFTTSTHLKNHMDRHKGIKRYQCSECSLCLTSLSSLKKHVLRLHAAVKPFPCDECDRSFVNMSERETHRLKMHSEKTQTCPVCDSQFHTRCTLRSHIKIVHAKNVSIEKFLRDYENDAEMMEIFRDHRKPHVES